MAQLSQCNITPYISPPKYKDYGVYPHSDFKYNKRYDSYTCPAGQRLTSNGKWRMRGKRRVKNYQNTKACRYCPIKHECTNRKAGRLIARYEHFEHVESNRKRIKKRPEYYKLRSQTIEHIFGTIKRHWGLDHTILRSKRKVKVEFDIAFTCYNLKRIKAILDLKKLFIRVYLMPSAIKVHTNKSGYNFIRKNRILKNHELESKLQSFSVLLPNLTRCHDDHISSFVEIRHMHPIRYIPLRIKFEDYN